MKRIKTGQRVKLADPFRIATRFFSSQHGGIVGAGYGCINLVPRDSLDGLATIYCLDGKGKTSDRGLVMFDSGGSMWLDADTLISAK